MTGPNGGRRINDSAMTPNWATIVALALAAATAIGRAQAPPSAELEELVDKVADYVDAYTLEFMGVVAEESYRQQFQRRGGTDARGFATEGQRQTRQLKSDVLLVRPPPLASQATAGQARWLQFRDVFEVDGKPVRDRAERLAKLFLQPSPSARQQIEDIKSESARYNIGGVNRNLNLPVLALSVVENDNRPWFSFTIGRKKDATCELAYRENRSGTLIRTNGDEAMPAHGKFVVERATGRVLATELEAESALLSAKIDVTYVPEPVLGGRLVPHEMREKYALKDGSTVEGRATYSNVRRFTVTVGEKVK